jgi:hypothetical protein
MSRQEFTKASTGRVIELYPQSIASEDPTVQVTDKHGDTLTAETAAHTSRDTSSTTVATASEEGDKRLSLAALTDLEIGRRYLVTNEYGQSERVTISGLDTSADAALFDERLERAYGVGSTFKGLRVAYALQTADLEELREGNVASFTLTNASGETHNERVVFDVVLYELPNPLTRTALQTRSPDISVQEWAEQRGEGFGPQREAAFGEVRRELRDRGFRPALIATPEDIFDWALAVLSRNLQEGGVSVIRGLDQDAALERLDARVALEKGSALSSISWYDATEDNARTEDEETPLTMDFVR